MAQIDFAAQDGKLAGTGRAAHALLYDQWGNPVVVRQNHEPADGQVAGIVSMGVNDQAILPMRLDRFGSVASALHTPLLAESFEGAVINPARWVITATTMTAAQSSVIGLQFNSGSSAAATIGYMIKSSRMFMKTQRQPIQAKMRARLNHVNNAVMELGFGDAATFNGAHTTGAYWQKQSSGALVPVVTYNSVDITGTDVSGLVLPANYYTFDVFMDDDEAVFVCQDSATGLIISKQSIPVPVTGQRLFSATQIAFMARQYHTGAAPATAPQLFLTDVYVAGLDAQWNLPVGQASSLMKRGLLEHPFSGVQLATFANSAAPANATLSNTAAGYATLGGLFSFVAVAGAATDYALFGQQVPIPATFVVTGVDIETWNTGAAVATTPTLLVWGLATELTAVSLATANHHRVALGAQSFPIGAAIGAKAERISVDFSQAGIVCGPGRYIAVILRMPVATATASQVVQGMVSFRGYAI